MISHFKKLDWWLILPVIILSAAGLAAIYSSSAGTGDFGNFKKQIIFLVIGVFLMFAASFIDWRIFTANRYIVLVLYFFCVLALLGLFFFAPVIRGIKGWYKFGPFSLDPVEITKLSLIILLAKYFSTRHIEVYRIVHILISGLYILLPVALIFFQPNLGSSLILIALWLVMLIVSGVKIRHFLLLLFCGFLVCVASWFFLLKDYQKQRVMVFIAPQTSSSLSLGWNQAQAKIAIGSGGIWGQGFLRGSQARYGFLPEPQTDFVFAVLAEEFGLVGVSVILLLFALLLSRIVKIASFSRANFPRLFSAGVAASIFCQVFINVGMNLGLLPIIGISLPFLSYGGSGLLAVFLTLGLLQSVKINQ
ncbi:MAG: FtsW/RodA/SpoVE family cell cycle protein [Patescibacteria group bacterium]